MSSEQMSPCLLEDVTCWLIAKYGIPTVSKLCACESRLPSSLTEAQRLGVLQCEVGLAQDELKQLRETVHSGSESWPY